MNDFCYVGAETLEIMAGAEKYNAYLERLVLKYIESGKSGNITVLDIGAGIGTFAKKISAKGYQVHCIEPDLQQSEQIKELGLLVDTSIENIDNNSVDFIYSLNVLEHIENDEEIFKVWTGKLKQGGSILIYVPAFNVLYSSFDKSVGHFRRYRKSRLIEIFKEAGLHIEEVRYADTIGFFVSLLYKWINKGNGKINKNSLKFYDKYLFPFNRLFDFLFSKYIGKNVFAVGKRI
ncbi:MAG: Ubiquinone biosynthesis O-methyltransferase [Candidatus Ordinivivax streblomastigis]|uniref:Ubiquinone biosynthesis O-methyltransferase n=1 Tax=Candidatus Ordinivivax streblomastigis TaxID=2540710 RepID=A0A5M8P2Z8_9BACT|nr:MAG: Ubiquinone biosynthesis O-methyltransferase [Candidatus Ordinivivax streblomastigis]